MYHWNTETFNFAAMMRSYTEDKICCWVYVSRQIKWQQVLAHHLQIGMWFIFLWICRHFKASVTFHTTYHKANSIVYAWFGVALDVIIIINEF